MGRKQLTRRAALKNTLSAGGALSLAKLSASAKSTRIGDVEDYLANLVRKHGRFRIFEPRSHNNYHRSRYKTNQNKEIVPGRSNRSPFTIVNRLQFEDGYVATAKTKLNISQDQKHTLRASDSVVSGDFTLENKLDGKRFQNHYSIDDFNDKKIRS